MYPARFEDFAPATVDEALSILEGYGCRVRFEADPAGYLAVEAQ
jgi:hypothetical protein